MESKFHRWWLGSCVAALLLASWVGGFSPAVTAVFIVIYLTGVTLIGPDEAPAEQVDVVAAEPVDVVAAEPVDVVAAAVPEPAVGETGEPPDDEKSTDDESPAGKPKSEAPADAEPAVDSAPAITADAETGPEAPADAEAVIVYESTSAAEQETVIIEDATVSDTEAEVTLADDEDDALPYPDDFDDEADKADAEVGERSPA